MGRSGSSSAHWASVRSPRAGPGRVTVKPSVGVVFLVVDSSTEGFAYVRGDTPGVTGSVRFPLIAPITKQALVPVNELIDPDRGLGLPAGFRGSRLPPPASEPLSERDAALMDLAQRATTEGHREVVLDDKTVQHLGAQAPDALWPHAELWAQVHAPSRRSLDEGDFRVTVAGVSRAAGTTTGRLLDLLTPEEQGQLTAPYRRLPTVREGALNAQASCPSVSGRGDQVSRAPARCAVWSR
ncbi:lantibiotic dehydratase [Haloactinospora alba]|uniref:lantibiotic dehydratase n=1 Tax=Haloactinospora alba TaxID=405555 RepID=UPI001FEBA0DD|nr:lantibiotic dehydratase [Haloactinospora alba]